jgi:hypothetical protein
MRQFLFVREAGQNKGARVESIQRWSDGQPGDSWCCEGATMCLDIAFQGNSPIPRLRACQDVYNMAKAKGWLISLAEADVDDVFLYVNDADHAHHMGLVTSKGAKTGIACNTSADGKSDNGDGCHEHGLISDPKHIKIVRFPRAA